MQGLLFEEVQEHNRDRTTIFRRGRRSTTRPKRRGRRCIADNSSYADRKNQSRITESNFFERAPNFISSSASSIHSRRVLRGRVVAIDVETTGLDPYHGARIFCWGYHTDAGEYGFMLNTDANIAWIKKLFDDPTRHIVFHHAKFDLKMFHFEGVDIFNAKCQFHCTLILSKLYNMNGIKFGHELEDLAEGYLRRPTEDKTAVIDWLKTNNRSFVKEHGRAPNFEDAPLPLVRRRCLWDVDSTIQLFAFLYPAVMQSCKKLYKTEIDLQLVVIDMENEGVQVDITEAKRLKAEAEAAINKLQTKLNEVVCPLTINRKKTRKRKGEKIIEYIDEEITDFNANSPIQMPAAFEKLGIELKYKTKPKKGKKGRKPTGGGRWAFDEYSMMRYSSKWIAGIIKDSGEESWPFDKFYDTIQKVIFDKELPDSAWLPPLVLKIRELKKMISTYYDHIIEQAVDVRIENGREIGILHCSFQPNEALTGRFSCKSPNLQNIPRILGPRNCFIPRKSRRLWYLDYSQVEMCLFAHFAEDAEMAQAIRDDVHKFVASQIYEVPLDQVTSEQRKRAKAINFGILYGSGPKTLAETLTERGIPTTKQEAAKLLRKYHRRFPSIRRLTNKLERQLIRNKFVVNPFGRRYHIFKDKAYTALNYMCQGTSADIIKAAMVKVWKWLRADGYRSKLLMTVHDELCFEVIPAEEKIVVPKIRELMVDRTSYYIPILVDAKCAKRRWSEKVSAEKMGLNFND